MNYMRILIEFIVSFLVIYLIYYFIIVRKCKKNNNYVPVEVNLVLSLYKIDYKKIDLIKMVKLVNLITTFIISVIITFINNLFDSPILVIVFGTIVSILLAIICYSFIGSYYKKISDKKHSNN